VVSVINDVQATAQAIPSLRPDEIVTLLDGEAVPEGTIALIAPGTGLGEAFLVWDGSGYRSHPSEGGHADFAPNDPDQADLLAYMKRGFRHVSYERVCSGIGIPNIYAWLIDTGRVAETPAVAQLLAGAADRTRIIVDSALAEHPCPLCLRTVEVFVSILAAVAGNLALKVMATGGVYLAGGIPKNILPLLEGERFGAAFSDKGRLSELVSRIPVHVITGDAALRGAAIWGMQADGGKDDPWRGAAQ
jgi:glucokinase